MSADFLSVLCLATKVSSGAMLLMLILRKPVRRLFGARVAYMLWACVPLSTFAAMSPAPTATMSLSFAPVIAASFAMPTSMPAVLSEVVPPFDHSSGLVWVWMLGAATMSLVLVRQQRRFVRGLGKLAVLDRETSRAQATVGCPVLLGAWRPRVVVPADFEQRYSTIERKLILAHERTHRTRGDAQINALVAASRCVFWFNPLIHFVASRFRFDQELACDATVISLFPEVRRSYADAMLKTQLANVGLPVGCQWQSSHPLKERIIMLKKSTPSRLRAALGAALATALVAAGSFAAWATQPANLAMDSARSSTAEFIAAAASPEHADVAAAAADFDLKMSGLNSRMDQVVEIFARDKGDFSGDSDSANLVMISSREMLLGERMRRYVQAIRHGGDDAQSAAVGMQRDAQFYGVLLAGLINGNPDFNIHATDNREARKQLTEIGEQWTALADSSVKKLLQSVQPDRM